MKENYSYSYVIDDCKDPENHHYVYERFCEKPETHEHIFYCMCCGEKIIHKCKRMEKIPFEKRSRRQKLLPEFFRDIY